MVIIGDSQTEGNNATSGDAWPMVFGRLRNETVYSMAVGGYSPVQYAYLAEKALELHPKTLMVGFYFGNDLVEAQSLAYNLDVWRDLRDPSYAPPLALDENPKYENVRLMLGSGARPGSLDLKILAIRTSIRNNSRLYALAGNATRSLRERVGVANTKEEKQEAIKDLAREYPDVAYIYEGALPSVLFPLYRLDTVDLNNPATAEGWRITQGRFLKIRDLADTAPC